MVSFNISTISLVQSILASFSAFACFLIIVTYIHFKDLQKLKNVELIFYVAFSTFLASIGMALGQQHSDTFGCWFQALVTNYFYLVSIIWITIMSFQVYSVIFSKVHLVNMLKYHVFCWGFPLVVTLLPLSTNTYGNNDDNPTWCYIKNTSYSPSFTLFMWELLAENVWIAVAIIVNITFLVLIRFRMRSISLSAEDISTTVTKLIWYPRMLIGCWGMAFIMIIYDRFYFNDSFASVFANTLAIILVTLQGMLTAIIFFITNKSIRIMWYNYLNEWYLSRYGPNVKPVSGKRSVLGGSTITRDTSESNLSSPTTSTSLDPNRLDLNSDSYYIHTAQSLDSLQATQNALHIARLNGLRNEVIEDYVDEEHFNHHDNDPEAACSISKAFMTKDNTVTSKQSLYSMYDRSSSEAFNPFQKSDILSNSLKADSFMPHNEDNEL